jgi:hypothetical protein
MLDIMVKVSVPWHRGLQAVALCQFCRTSRCRSVAHMLRFVLKCRLVLSMQVYAMLEVYPDRFHAYTYPLGSILAAWLSGLAIYGAAAWAHM